MILGDIFCVLLCSLICSSLLLKRKKKKQEQRCKVVLSLPPLIRTHMQLPPPSHSASFLPPCLLQYDDSES